MGHRRGWDGYDDALKLQDEKKKKKEEEERKRKEERAKKLAEFAKNPSGPNFVISKRAGGGGGGEEVKCDFLFIGLYCLLHFFFTFCVSKKSSRNRSSFDLLIFIYIDSFIHKWLEWRFRLEFTFLYFFLEFIGLVT